MPDDPVIERIRSNFNALDRQGRLRVIAMITPESLEVAKLLLGPQVADFIAHYHERHKQAVGHRPYTPLKSFG